VGSNQQCGSLNLLVSVGTVLPGTVLTGTVLSGTVGTGTASDYAAFRVFFGFEVLEFDRFLNFFLCHFIFLSGWFVSCQ